MSARGWKLIASYESPILAKLLYDPIVVEDRESNGCLPDPPWADESDGLKVFSEFDDLFNQLVTPETVPRCRGR